MFDVRCHRCETRYLVGTRSIVSLHNTGDGPIAYVRCPAGHLLVHDFRNGVTDPVAAKEEQVA